MSTWKYRPPTDDRNTVNFQLGNVESTGNFLYPNLRDESDLILASDYSGEHQGPEFQVLAFLLTHKNSVLGPWESARMSVRKAHLSEGSEGRRMAFKKLNDALRINALSKFLDAASLLNGVLVCVAVDKAHSLRDRGTLRPLQHDWAPDTFEKLLRICVFGGGFVDGLRKEGQTLFWLTDDDAIVATENAQKDAAGLMGGYLHKHPGETLLVKLGIASQFDDGFRAEDLLAIPDLAAGAFSEGLTELGKSNIPTSERSRTGIDLSLQIKTMLINAWRIDESMPLKHLNLVINVTEDGKDRFTFCQPTFRFPLGEAPQIPELNAKWRRALTEAMKRRNS
jgi:hypothetical protein